MWKRKKPRLRLGLMLTAPLCLLSCATANCNSCPVYPVAGPKVAAELEQAAYQNFPHTWEWLGRIDKLRQELELCR